jgi:tetratricopeptide (TPR) repeat protein
MPGDGELAGELKAVLEQAENARAHAEKVRSLHDLHQLADRVRFLGGTDALPRTGLPELEQSCRALWERRHQVLSWLAGEGLATEREQTSRDLLDLVVFWAALHVRLAPSDGLPSARAEVMQMLTEAETLLGDSPLLRQERRTYAVAIGRTVPMKNGRPAQTAWEHCCLGRALLNSDDLEGAAEHLRLAVRMEPGGLWPNFYAGLCAARQGRHEDAVIAFSTCIGVRPDSAVLFVNRALALEELERPAQALADYDRALEREPALAVVWLRRGLLRLRQKQAAEAVSDLRHALDNGADPATTCYHLARAHLAANERDAARERLRQALGLDPQHADARALLQQLDPR